MEALNQIINFAEQAYAESQKQIEMHEKWVAYVSPLFKENFGIEYRPEYEQFYNKYKLEFLEDEKKSFSKLNF